MPADWTHAECAAALGASKEWAKTWLKRFRDAQAAGESLEHVLSGHSQARTHPPVKTHPFVVEQVLAMRDQPPEGLRRVPGQEAIHSYLQRDPALHFCDVAVPSAKTSSRILKSHQRIPERDKPLHQPLERPAPMTCWHLDFKDVSSVPADRQGGGKQQHGVETLTIIAMGTSMLLEAHVRSNFTAETA